MSARRARTTGDVLREARERAGLSLRQLARRLGMSWVSVRNAESGCDVKASTLRRYLAVLPDLAPHDVLSGAARAPQTAAGSVWELYRQLFGFEAAEVTKVIDIKPTGDCLTTIETRGLRSLRGDMRDLNILVGLQRAVFQGAGSVLQSIEAASQDFTTRLVERRDGRAVHQFKFPRKLAQAGITYTRRHLTTRLYQLHAVKAAAVLRGPGPFIEGSTSPVMHPTSALKIVVRFPGRYWPRELRVVIWPTVHVPDYETPDLAIHLHPAGIPIRRNPAENSVTLRLARPMVGLKYGLRWELP